ncbi:MAG: winged helix-turn-helix domain-containing protein [Acidobacteria bacterium]|nr:winged helix-turn-helix domain-containing protein [Acidobacteriota bacterium]
MEQTSERVYEFGPFRLNPLRRVLLREGRPVALTGKVFDTLLVFVERRGRVLAKDELMSALWPDTAVEENNLTQHVSMLRKALGERTDGRRYVVTVPGRGYSFVEPVREVEPETSEERPAVRREAAALAETAAITVGASHPPRSALAVAMSVAIISTAAALYLWTGRAPSAQAPAAPTAARRERRHTTEVFEAREAYLRGRYFWNKRNPEGVEKSVEHFRRALDLDPTYAAAYAGLADAYSVLGNYRYGTTPPEECFVRARAAALKAVEVDDELSEAHASLALIKAYQEMDAEGAEREFRRAIELDTAYATAHHWYSDFLATRGRADEALSEAVRAAELDPLSPIISTTVGERLFFARDYRRAAERLRRTLELDPDFIQARLFLGLVHLREGRRAEAVTELTRARELAGGTDARVAVALVQAYAVTGRKAEARRLLEELSAAGAEVAPSDMALVHASLGEREQAYEWLKQARDKARTNPEAATLLRADPRLDALRADPKFRDIFIL